MDGADLVERILGSAASATRAEARALLRPLQDYDERHGGDLLRTLTVYLEAGANASKAAALLYLHRSGFLYRLARIEALLGLRLDRVEVRLALAIAIRAVSGAAPSGEWSL
jgi:DNA-binding PucR family transcriptional regulator